jgi:hypothetical protein
METSDLVGEEDGKYCGASPQLGAMAFSPGRPDKYWFSHSLHSHSIETLLLKGIISIRLKEPAPIVVVL